MHKGYIEFGTVLITGWTFMLLKPDALRVLQSMSAVCVCQALIIFS